MDAERDKKMDLLQADMAGLKLHQESNFAYKKSTFTTTSLPVMTHVAQLHLRLNISLSRSTQRNNEPKMHICENTRDEELLDTGSSVYKL